MHSKQFLMTIFFVLAVFRLFIIPQGTGDLAIWIADGLSFLENFQIQRVDTFTLHKSLEFIYPARISSIIFAFIYKFLDLSGVTIFIRLCLALAIWINYKKYISPSMPWNIINLMTIICASIGMTLFLDRPACLGILYATILFPYLMKESLDKKDSLIVFLCFILWSNTHSSILILAPVIAYKFLLSLFFKKELRTTFIIGLFLSLSLLMTPEGFNIFEYVYSTVSVSKGRTISEWSHAFEFIHPEMSLLYFATFLLLFFQLYRHNKLIDAIKTPFFVLFFLGFFSIRNSVWLFTFIICYFHYFKLWDHRENIFFKNRSLNTGLTCLAITYLLYASPYNSFKSKKNDGYGLDAPVEIAHLLAKQTVPQRILNQWELGSYLILKQPHPVFIDTRNIIYSNGIFSDYKKLMNCHAECESRLDKYDINAVVLRQESWPIIDFLRSKWMITFEDKDFIFFQRKSPTSLNP